MGIMLMGIFVIQSNCTITLDTLISRKVCGVAVSLAASSKALKKNLDEETDNEESVYWVLTPDGDVYEEEYGPLRLRWKKKENKRKAYLELLTILPQR